MNLFVGPDGRMIVTGPIVDVWGGSAVLGTYVVLDFWNPNFTIGLGSNTASLHQSKLKSTSKRKKIAL